MKKAVREYIDFAIFSQYRFSGDFKSKRLQLYWEPGNDRMFNEGLSVMNDITYVLILNIEKVYIE